MPERRDTDGYLARYDRRLSGTLTRLMLPFPITPNHITTVCLLLGLLGARRLACASRAGQLSGAIILCFCAILDGCDGEVARRKNLSSAWGAAYDEAADHAANLAAFIAIPIGVHRLHPRVNVVVPGVLLISGVLVSMLAVWRLVLRAPEDVRRRYPIVIERLASRDFVYLILLACLLGHLDWFFWAAAIGSHAFYMALGMARLRTQTA